MKYAELITVSEQGFHIEDHLLKPIGITNESNCWGILIDQKNHSQETNLNKDLIISSIPFRSWACVVRIQIRVKKKDFEQNLIKMYEILYSNDMSIFSMQLIYSGYKHYTLDIIAEIVSLRKNFEDYRTDDKLNKNERFEHIREHFAKLCIKMLKVEDETVESKILYDSFENDYPDIMCIDNYKVFLDNNITIKKRLLGCLKAIQFKNIKWNWIRSLALHATYHSEDRIRFRFIKQNGLGLLKPDDTTNEYKDFISILKKFDAGYINNIKYPFLAMASFNSESNYIRLRSMHDKELY